MGLTQTAQTALAATAPAAAGGFRWALALVLAVVFIALLFFGLLATGALRRDDPVQRLEDQLSRHYAARHGSRPPAADETGGRMAGAAVGWVSQALGSDAQLRLALRLDLAGIERKPAEWVVMGGAASLVLALLLTLIGGNALLGIPAGLLLGWLGMRLLLSVAIGRRRAAFAEQLPDVLQIIAGSLQSGFSLPQALDSVVRDDTQPAAAEFSRAIAETRIGGELEVALERVADRMGSMDLRWTVMAIRIQRSVGGNLVEVLHNTVEMMRERSAIRRHVRALSAEGRLSAYILIALPLLVGGWLFFSRDSYMHPLYTTPLGLAMLITAAVLMVLGTWWMRNVIKVEA
jgi:Flp pilus assembly protein TadB